MSSLSEADRGFGHGPTNFRRDFVRDWASSTRHSHLLPTTPSDKRDYESAQRPCTSRLSAVLLACISPNTC
jgi:hypothetical protein